MPAVSFCILRLKDHMARSGIKPHEELHELLQFERLLAEISTFFINLPADQIGNEIVAAQKRICELLDLDRSALLLTAQDDPGMLLLTHVHQPPGSPPPPDRLNARDFFPWTVQKILSGEIIAISKMTELPAEACRDREVSTSSAPSPLFMFHYLWEKARFLAWWPSSLLVERDWPKRVVQQFQLVAQIFANALSRKCAEKEIEATEASIKSRRTSTCGMKIMLQQRHEEIVGRSAAMKKVLAQAEQVARTDSTVLILGETGTGKELFARTIHNLSNRKERPLITINCAALPPALIETELFGRERGAYTGAMTRMAGRFEVADRSTLFLDEIGELSLDLQVKLLRVLEEGRFERLGSTKSLQVNVRIIAATNRDLAQEVAARRFRNDCTTG